MRFIIFFSLFVIIACKSKKAPEKIEEPFPESKYDPLADSLELIELSKNQNPRNLDISPYPTPAPNFDNPDDPENSKQFLYEPATGWYLLPDSVGGKPFSFYLGHSGVSAIAKNFAAGTFRASDNDSTMDLMRLMLTDDSTLRPFYRWCADHILSISDGALSEMVGEPAMEYAMKFPAEFMDYYYSKRSGQYQWVSLMGYSILTAITTAQTFKKDALAKLNSNCKPCDPITEKRIQRFAREMEEIAKDEEYFK